MKITKTQLIEIIKEELNEYGISNFGGKAGQLGAVAGRKEPVYDDDPDSEIKRKAFELFSELTLTTEVVRTLVDNIAIPDLERLIDVIPKIDTAEQEDVEVAERKLSKAEKKRKEKVVKGMKKSKKDFKKRYGDDAESEVKNNAIRTRKIRQISREGNFS
jgi:hypothetical protein